MEPAKLDKEIELGIETTVMAIREEVMRYFKGTCIDRMTEGGLVNLVPLNRPNRYYYERQRAETECPQLLTLGNAPVLTMRKAPDKVEIHTGVLKRSPQLSKVYKLLDQFFNDYLPAVERSENNATVFYK